MSGKRKRSTSNARLKSGTNNAPAAPKPGVAKRPPKKVTKVRKNFLGQTGVHTATFLNSLGGEIRLITSDQNQYQTFYAKQGSSPVALVRLQKESSQNLGQVAQDLSGDLDQVYGKQVNQQDREIDLPNRLVFTVDKNDLSPSQVVEMTENLISRINENQPPDKQYRLDLVSEEFTTSTEQNIALTFRVTGNQNLPEGTSEGSPASPRDPGLPIELNQGVLNTQRFDKAMGRGRLSIRSSEYKRITSALDRYNRVLSDYQAATRNGDNKQQYNQAVSRLFAERQNLLEAAEAYLQTSNKSADKVQVVRRLIAELGPPASSEARLKNVASTIPWGHSVKVNNPQQDPSGLRPLPTNTASTVYRVETNDYIGNTNKKVAYAKKAEHQQGDILTTTDPTLNNLGKLEIIDNIKVAEPPNLLARQVVTSRIDRFLGTRVIAEEVFSRTADTGEPIGLTAQANGTQVLNQTPNQDVYTFFDMANQGNIQKGLSNLQLMDAITGQMDRHLGNIFINKETGEVTGIDNDMAFPKHGATNDDLLGTNSLNGLFERDNQGNLIYKQTQIDREVGERILQLDRAVFEQILRGRESDPEKLAQEPEAINAALERFDAVRAQILNLKNQTPNQLVSNWDGNTYQQAVGQGKTRNYFNNYVALIADRFEQASTPLDQQGGKQRVLQL